MGDYSKMSNYNPKSNFSMVRFGANAPVTEFELNEVQQIQHNTMKHTLENLVGDCFLKQGDLMYDSNNLILKPCVAHVNGLVFEVSELSTTIASSETVYLEVFTKTCSMSDDIQELGNTQSSTHIENYLGDVRLSGIETARREQICYNLTKDCSNPSNMYLPICILEETGRIKDLRPKNKLQDMSTGGSYNQYMISQEDCELLNDTVSVPTNISSKGACLFFTTDATNKTRIKGKFNNLHYGRYTFCLRLALATQDAKNLVTVRIFKRGVDTNKDTTITTKVISGSNFTASNSFIPFYFSSIDFTGDNTEMCELWFEIQSHADSTNIGVLYDYIFASMSMPSVYI